MIVSVATNKFNQKERRGFGSFAFACALGQVSRKSKCAKLGIAVYRRFVMVNVILTSGVLAITARQLK